MNQPNQPNQPTTVEFPKWNITFEVGKPFSNYIGDYTVAAIHGSSDTMDVVYANGKNQTLQIAGQAKVIHNQKVRELKAMKMQELNLQGTNETFTLGYLAQHTALCVRVKECRQLEFEETYRKLTGVQAPTPNVEGHYYTVSPDAVQGSWDYWHVIFPAPDFPIRDHMLFGKATERQVLWDTWGKFSKYNDRNYVLHLFNLGFRLGKHHEADAIRNRLKDKESFDEGYFCPTIAETNTECGSIVAA